MQVLKVGMDLALIDTGREGLTVTHVELKPCDVFRVAFNNKPDHSLSADGWIYDGFGIPQGDLDGRLPNLSLKQAQVDWSKPIRIKGITQTPIWLISASYVRIPGAEPCVAIGIEASATEPLLRTLNNEVIPQQFGGRWVIENAPPEPVVTKRQLVVHENGGFFAKDVALRKEEAALELIYTDGILTDARIREPNRAAA